MGILIQMALCWLLLVDFTHFGGLDQGYSFIQPHLYILICVFLRYISPLRHFYERFYISVSPT